MTTSTTPNAGATGSEQGDPRWLRVVAVPAMLVLGALVAVQSQINGELAGELGADTTAGLAAALISFGSGSVLLCAAVAVFRPMRRGLAAVRAALLAGRLRPWHVVGGIAGAFLVVTQGLTVGTIGVALFIVAVVGGQTSSGLAVDHHGVGPSGPQPVSPLRGGGAALTVGAVGLSASGRLGGADALSASAVALALLPLAAGAAIAWQQAVNGRVSVAGGAWAATWVNFAVGTVALLLATTVALLVDGSTDSLPSGPSSWWLYLGGPIGVAFICAAAVLVRVHGVLVLGLCTVCGQVTSALLVDQLVGGGPLGAPTLVGATLTLLGVVLAGLGTRRSMRRRRSRPTPAS